MPIIKWFKKKISASKANTILMLLNGIRFANSGSIMNVSCSKMVISTINVQSVSGLDIESRSRVSNVKVVFDVHFCNQYIIKKRIKTRV